MRVSFSKCEPFCPPQSRNSDPWSRWLRLMYANNQISFSFRSPNVGIFFKCESFCPPQSRNSVGIPISEADCFGLCISNNHIVSFNFRSRNAGIFSKCQPFCPPQSRNGQRRIRCCSKTRCDFHQIPKGASASCPCL